MIFCLVSCHSEKNNFEEQKKDSVNYTITENFNLWLSTQKPNGDTGNIYLIEIIVENKTNQPIYLPIADQIGYVKPIYFQNHSFDDRIISMCILYHFKRDTNQSGQWSMNSDCPFFASRRELKAHTKESFYLTGSGPNDVKQYADSFVVKMDYWFDTLVEKQKHAITKNLFTSGKKLVEIEKFKSFEH